MEWIDLRRVAWMGTKSLNLTDNKHINTESCSGQVSRNDGSTSEERPGGRSSPGALSPCILSIDCFCLSNPAAQRFTVEGIAAIG